jgi:hypothetical protein
MTTTPPTLREWHEDKPPEICTVQSLNRSIPNERYSRVYWIAKLVDNVVSEAHPLSRWYFSADGRLRGMVDTEVWKLEVEIMPDEYVILSMR